jgi:hypothetical protein
MNSIFINRSVIVWYLVFSALVVLFADSTEAGERAKRPMKVVKQAEIGLEIWVEYRPAWNYETVNIGRKATLVASSPDNYYPPAVMSYAGFPELRVKNYELEDVARAAIERAAANYQARIGKDFQLTPATYGTLAGFEGDLSGRVEGVPVDVRIFVGQQDGHWPVSMSIYTLAGKLPHVSEQIRRAWTNVSYLEN